ncbi:hypothetical protein P692DRAFT_201809453 [Suillus brevipes Sb2]|nr:hypothetical protein P692DRAFT_201809453 [Suillus brevipes Sb2]
MWRAGKAKAFLELVAHKTSALVGFHKSPTRTPHTLSCVGLSSKKMKKKTGKIREEEEGADEEILRNDENMTNRSRDDDDDMIDDTHYQTSMFKNEVQGLGLLRRTGRWIRGSEASQVLKVLSRLAPGPENDAMDVITRSQGLGVVLEKHKYTKSLQTPAATCDIDVIQKNLVRDSWQADE